MQKHIDALIQIGTLIRTQDNRITNQPIFIVQQKVIDWGYGSEYAEDYKWIDNSDGEYPEADEELAAELEEMVGYGDVTAGWEKVYYKERWEFVTACFTEQGCKDYIEINGHNLNETRIYAEGSYRNNEYRAVREAILAIEMAVREAILVIKARAHS